MNLLYLLRNNQSLSRMQNNYHITFHKSLSNHFNIVTLSVNDYNNLKTKSIDVLKVLNDNSFIPDVLFLTYLNKSPYNFININKLSNTYKIIHKVDNQTKNINDYILKQNFNLCVNVVSYNNLTIKTPKNVNHKLLMHSIDPDLFQDYNQNRDIDVLLAGAIGPHYPLRLDMILQLSLPSNLNIHSVILPGRSPHKDYRTKYSKQIEIINKNSNVKFKDARKIITRDKYSNFLNRAKITAFCSSVYKIPISKYLEASACGSLVLADCPKNAKEYGLINGETFVEVNSSNFIEKVRYYLKNNKERQRITNNAKKLIMKKHTHDIRVNNLLKFIENHK
jgi:glycosyltransferase involved in cell wall biosynthesis